MWPGKTVQSTLLVVGAGEISWISPASSRRLLELPHDAGLPELLRALPEALAEVPASPASVVEVCISDRWMQWLALPWTDQLLADESAVQSVRSQFAAFLDINAADSVIAADDRPYGDPRCCVTLPRELRDVIDGGLQACGHRIQSMRPLSVALLEKTAATGAPRGDSWGLCIAEPGYVTLAAIGGGYLQAVVGRHNADPLVEGRRLWNRLKLRQAEFSTTQRLYAVAGDSIAELLGAVVPQPAMLQVIEGPVLEAAETASASPAMRTRVEFQASPPPVTRRGLIAAVAGMVTVASAMLYFLASATATSGLEQELQLLQSHVQPAVGGGIQDARQVSARIASVNEAIRQLNMPMEQLMQAIKVPSSLGVALLAVDFKGGGGGMSGSLRITAEAKTSEAMTGYISALSQQSLFHSVFLTRHEVAESQAARPYRFVVDASWLP